MLELMDISVVRSGTTVLSGVSVSIQGGRCTALVGPSGAGKTTLLRLLDRLEEPSSGTITLHDKALTAYDVLELRRRVGLVQQAPVILGETILEDLRTGAAVTEADALSLLARAGLDGFALDRATASLSGGEAQRLCLARALAVQPEVLLLDEPTSALDDVAAQAVEQVVRGLVAEGLTAVLVSHDRQQARRLADDVIGLQHGRVTETGPVSSSRYLAS